MTLRRDHGMWTYRACSLEITLFLNASRASFDCDAGEGGRVQSAREMTDDEVTGLRRFAQAADLMEATTSARTSLPGTAPSRRCEFVRSKEAVQWSS